MSQLKTNLQEILAEKQQKIIAENIRRNVSVFGVIGTLDEADFTGVNVDEDCVLENTGSGEVTAINAGGKFRGKILNSGGIDYICLRDDEHPADGVEYVDNGNDNDSYVLAAWNDITKLMPQGKIPDEYSQKGIFIPTDGPHNMTEVHINQGHLKAAIGLTAEKIVQGNTILGVAGTAIPEDTQDYNDCLDLTNQILGNV